VAKCLLLYVYVFALSVIGGKAYELIDNWFYYRHNPGKILSLAGHGFSGGIIMVFLGLSLWLWLSKRPLLVYLDIFALYLPVAIAIGRVGCLITADGDYGIPTDLPWGMTFKHGYFPTSVPVHPTPLYEIIAMALLFILLHYYIQKLAPGWVLAIYLMLYSVQRFLAEFIRLNRIFAWSLTLPQWACILQFLAGALLALYLAWHKRRD